MSNKRRIFSTAFKTKVVLEALREDKTISELSMKYDLTPKNIHNWKATFLANAELAIDPSKSVAEYKKLSDNLQIKVDNYAKKVGELTLDKEFLEGKLESLALSDRKDMIDAKLTMTITKQCDLLLVPRSSIYYKPVENIRKQALLKAITEIHEEISCYGYIKACKQLLENGYSVSENTVQKYRQELGIKAILAVKKPKLSIANKKHAIYSYKLRGLNIVRSNQVWSTDITYIKTKTGTVYMAAIIDWYSKAVLSWEISNIMDSTLVMRVLNQALEAYGTPEIFNTDQGSQYTSYVHTNKLKEYGVEISMDGKGRATDNICIERFWRSAKCERIYLNEYNGITDLRLDVSDYINFYNNRRFHETIKYEKPMVFYHKSISIKKAA
jgi:putative transposase